MSGGDRRSDPSWELPEAGDDDTTLAWDLPTRLFKWTLVALVVTAWVSSGFDDPEMKVHKVAGYGILVLLVFRLIWGFVGGSTARLASFVKGPRAIAAHMRALKAGRAGTYLGHNPAGGFVILMILAACSVQVGLGLMASDGVMAAGPFADRVGDGWASLAGTLHGYWFYALLSLAIVHILANLYYEFIRGERLVTAMVTGRKARAAFVDALYLVRAPASLAFWALVLSVAIVFGLIALSGGGLATPS